MSHECACFRVGAQVIKTIFVPTSGAETDRSVLETALAAGRVLDAHLDLFHVDLSAGEASAHAHLEFCQGPELADALGPLSQHEKARSVRARKHFETFCAANRIPVYNAPGGVGEVSASWLQQTDRASERLLFQARHHDLIVLGRRRNNDYLPGGLIEALLVQSGRPILIAPPAPPRSVTGTVVVGWKETAEAARSLAFSLPLLKQAKNVLLLAVSEHGAASSEALHDCAQQLAWHGVIAEVVTTGDGSRSAAVEMMEATARARAELLVVGGFGHGQLRELIFGGVTQALIGRADLPVFMAH